MTFRLLLIGAALAAGLCGACRPAQVAPEWRTTQRCADAADMAQAQQLRYDEQIVFLYSQQEVLDLKQRDLFSEMLSFRNRESSVMRDPGVPMRDREAYAAMYDSLAINRDGQIVRCKELNRTLSGSINSWAGKRDDKIREYYVYSQARPVAAE